MEAGRKATMGATLYTTSYPCNLCAKMIIQGGIKRICYIYDYNSALSKDMFSQTDIEIVWIPRQNL